MRTYTDSRERFALPVAALTLRAGVGVTAMKKRGFGSTALCVNRTVFAMLGWDGEVARRGQVSTCWGYLSPRSSAPPKVPSRPLRWGSETIRRGLPLRVGTE